MKSLFWDYFGQSSVYRARKQRGKERGGGWWTGHTGSVGRSRYVLLTVRYEYNNGGKCFIMEGSALGTF